MEHQPINLATETIEQNFTHFLSQSTPDTSVEHWEKQDFDYNFLETFKDKSAWAESTAKLAEAFSELVDSEELQEAQKAQHQAVEAALDTIEEALLDFYKTIRYFSAEERQQGFAKASLHQSLLKLDKIDDVFSQAKLGFFNFPHLPRLTYLTAYILQASLKLHPSEENSWVAEVAFGRINQEIQMAMESVYRERHYRIKFDLSGPYHNLAYVYDEHTERSLTNWVELSENARKVHDAHYVLQERIADLYVQSLPFNQVSEMVTKLWGQGETTSWATVKKNCVLIDLTDESNAELSASIKELTLDWVKASYFPEFSVAIQASNVTVEDWKRTNDTLMAEFLGGFLRATGAALAEAAAGPIFGPAFLALFRTIWERARIARGELSDMDRAIEEALTKEEILDIRHWFNVCFNAYTSFFSTLNDEPHIGSVTNQDWLHLRTQTYNLQRLLFLPRRVIHYQTHQLVSEAMVMRVNTLMGACGTALATNATSTMSDIGANVVEMLNQWYGFMEELRQQSYNRTRGQRDFMRENRFSGLPGAPWLTINDMLAKQLRLSHDTRKEPQSTVSFLGVTKRVDYYVTLNTELLNLCRGYDIAVRRFREVGINLNMVVQNAEAQMFHQNFMNGMYMRDGRNYMNDARNRNIWPGGNLFWWLGHFELAPNPAAEPRLSDFGVGIGSGGTLRLSVGDYPDLQLFSGLENGASGTINVPQGLVAVVYADTGYRGRPRQFPEGSDILHNATQSLPFRVLSMKVRIDVGGRWFPGRFNHHLGRLDTGFYFWEGGWDNPISPPLVQLP
ncbi:MAG: hypothetical protein RM021_018975 [Nostoc sp. EkiNYC01]